MKDHSSDSYQPRDNDDHSKVCILGGDGSIVAGRFGDGVVPGVRDINVRMVCRGSDGSHESI